MDRSASGPTGISRCRWRDAAIVGGVAFGFVPLIGVVARVNEVSFMRLSRDSLAAGLAGEAVWYSGWISNFGAVVWSAALAASGLALLGTWPRATTTDRRFLASSFLFTGILLVDDLYMVHDLIGPLYLGIPELAGLATLGVAGFTWLAINLPRLLRDPDLPILLLACVFFGIALVLDVFDQRLQAGSEREEGGKLVGILCWAAFHWRVALRGFDTAVTDAG